MQGVPGLSGSLSRGVLVDARKEVRRGGGSVTRYPAPHHQAWRRTCHLVEPKRIVEEPFGQGPSAALVQFQVGGSIYRCERKAVSKYDFAGMRRQGNTADRGNSAVAAPDDAHVT